MQLERDVAPGIHRIQDAYVNWYLVEEQERVCIVDAGHPASWKSLQSALEQLALEEAAVEAVILTHAHFDHVGFAERARAELEVPVWVHEDDRELATSPWDYEHERGRLPYAARHPSFNVVFAAMAAKGAPLVRGVQEARTFADGDVLEVPGRPVVIHLPGHTWGQCAFHYPDRDAVLVGDAMVTHDPYTNGDGPRIVAGGATADSARALQSLAALEAVDASTVLTGHGPAWRKGTREAVAVALQVGAT